MLQATCTAITVALFAENSEQTCKKSKKNIPMDFSQKNQMKKNSDQQKSYDLKKNPDALNRLICLDKNCKQKFVNKLNKWLHTTGA